MFTSVPVRLTTIWQNQNLTLETGLLAKQATASVLATLGETSVLATVVLGKETSQDWLPLQVIYEERLYASGKIKGSRFIKREGRPTDNAVLTGRMVDRSIRSLFNNNIRQEIQVVITVLSLDEVNSPDVLAVLAASSALSLCGLVEQDNKEKVAFMGPISAVRIGIAKMVSTTITDPASTDSLKLVANPNYSEIENSDLDLVVSGNGKNIVMIEAGANIIDEETMLQAIQLAETELAILNNFQAQFIVSAKPKTLSVKVKNILN